jgi:hypothetical protein
VGSNEEGRTIERKDYRTEGQDMDRLQEGL